MAAQIPATHETRREARQGFPDPQEAACERPNAFINELTSRATSHMKEQAEVRTLKEGRFMLIDDEPCKIDSITKSKPGKHGAAKARIEGRSIFTGSKKTYMGSVTDKIWIPVMDRRQAQILAVMGDQVQLMDSESFETFELPIGDVEGAEAGKDCTYIDSMGRRMLQSVAGS